MSSRDALTVLLVEDDDGHARLAEKSLRRSDFGVTIVRATNGEQALDFVRGEGIHRGQSRPNRMLVLLDLKMPVIDGYTVLRELKKDAKTRMIPVVVITTTDDQREVDYCRRLGCDGYLTKPIGDERIAAALRRYAQGQS